ncbi:hypothetical protein FACS189449_10480 [Alphaproteobacteria bacterium]|nr:hypothetical protein FACS189449_10480 [Alphaproteobacteria bacterium]
MVCSKMHATLAFTNSDSLACSSTDGKVINSSPARIVTLICFFLMFLTFDLFSTQFVSLKSSQVNLRVGPGKEYPVSWIFMWANLPVMVITEFQQWRKIKFLDGTEGWVHQNMVSRKNMVIVVVEYAVMYKYSSKSHPIAKIEKNVICRVLKKENHWLKVEANNIKGWIEDTCVWGVSDN